MTAIRYSILADRGVVEISGEEARSFLQGMISNDIDKLTPGQAIYAAFLTPQGKYLFDFFIVEFAAGARNKLHTHTSDQVLYVTKGRGRVGTESETFDVEEGDTAFIPAGEKHWHGATDDSDFAHIALTHPDSVTEVHG